MWHRPQSQPPAASPRAKSIRTASVREVIVGDEKLSTTRDRGFAVCPARKLAMHFDNPPARAPGLFGGTTMPVSPTRNPESPTSVTTQGTPQAIASAIALGVPSPKADDEQAMSSAL